MNPLKLVLSIAAGVLGGAVSPYLYEPSPVQAQAIIPAPKIVEIKLGWFTQGSWKQMVE